MKEVSTTSNLFIGGVTSSLSYLTPFSLHHWPAKNGHYLLQTTLLLDRLLTLKSGYLRG